MNSSTRQQSNRSSLEKKYRMGIIRAGLMGAQLQYHQEELYMFPFVDYISLFFQSLTDGGPLAFLLWHGNTCKFSSLGDLYFTSKYQLAKEQLKRPDNSLQISKKDDIWLSIHKIKNLDILERKFPDYNVPREESINQDYILEPFPEAIADVKELFFGKSTALGPNLKDVSGFIPLVAESIKMERRAYPQTPSIVIPELNYETEVMPLLEDLRRVLDDVFEDTQMVQRVESKTDKPKLDNIYCVIQTVSINQVRCGWFPYTAGLLLSRKQKSNLEEWCSNCIGERTAKGKQSCGMVLQHGKECPNILEYPLGQHSRSVADAVFCSGIIDFARKPNDRLWDRADARDERDLVRIKIESCIYPAKSDVSLYYVPIHVGGIPWLSLFTFTPKAYKGKWLHNYTFYNSVIPRASSLIREQVRQLYLVHLGKIAAENIFSLRKSPISITEEVNKKWKSLAQIFPFPLFRLYSDKPQFKKEGPAVIDITAQGKWYISCVDNPFFGKPQVRWGNRDGEHLNNFIDVLHNQLAERQMQKMQVLDDLHHNLGTSVTKLDSILRLTDLSDSEKVAQTKAELINLNSLYKSWLEPKNIETVGNISLSKILLDIKKTHNTNIVISGDDLSDISILANSERLFTHLNELIINGIKAAKGNDKVQDRTVSINCVVNINQRVEIQISDKGLGMPDEIFNEALSRPIYKDNRLHRGLYNSFRYLQEIGGSILKGKNEGRGTTLTVSLPITGRLAE